jgi:hypothetical protein
MPNAAAKQVGFLKNVIIENISGDDNYKQGSLISGIKDHPITDVIIRNYKIKMQGGGDSTLIAQEVPEKEGGYPDAQSFLKQGLPSMGFYVRYAENININNAEIKALKPDARPIILAGKNVIELFFNGEKISQ